MDALDKPAIVRALRARIQSEIDAATRLAKDAAEAVTHEDNRPEGDKDMRSTEASYVARGQAERVRTLEAALAALAAMPVRTFGPSDVIQVSALVELSDGKSREVYLLVSAAGGIRVPAGAREVQTLAVQSPLGKALLGLSEGDEAEVSTARGVRTYEVLAVR